MRLAAAVLTAVTVGVAVGDDAGYSEGPRLRFGILAALALAAAIASDPGRARRLARSPVLVVLAVLAAFGALSAAWTVGIAGDALRWALVTAGFAAVALAVAILADDERSIRRAGAGLAVLATAIGLVGLIGAAEAIVPLAHREAGRWRPAAMFQYAPALALAMVGALPALLAGMVRPGRPARTASAFGAAVAGAVFGLAESRVELGLGAAVCAIALLWPRRTVGAARGAVAAAVALVVASGLGAYAVAGGYVVVTPPPDGTLRLAKIAAVLAGATLAWALATPALRRGGRAAIAVAASLLALGIGAAVTKPPARLISSGVTSAKAPPHPSRARLSPIRDRLLHGRLKIWRAAVETFADRPLHGGGADSFWFASSDHQGPRTVFYAHELPLELAAELGVGGLLLAVALYVTGTLALLRARAGPAIWLLGPAAAAFLAANLVDWPWHFAGSGAIWAVGLGGVLASPRTAPSA